MNIVVRKNIGAKLKNPASEIGYYSYINHSDSPCSSKQNPLLPFKRKGSRGFRIS